MGSFFPDDGENSDSKKGKAPALKKVLTKVAETVEKARFTASIPLTRLKHTEIPIDPRARNTIVEEPRGYIPR